MPSAVVRRPRRRAVTKMIIRPAQPPALGFATELRRLSPLTPAVWKGRFAHPNLARPLCAGGPRKTLSAGRNAARPAAPAWTRGASLPPVRCSRHGDRVGGNCDRLRLGRANGALL